MIAVDLSGLNGIDGTPFGVMSGVFATGASHRDPRVFSWLVPPVSR
jgi:hypothetical protein